ncbi:MAG: cytochrome c family protein [Geminicoccaceae bacterium]
MASSLEGNKIAAAILTAGIIGVGSGVLSGIIYRPVMLEEPVYAVATADASGGDSTEAAAPAEEKPIGELLASADPAAGEAVAKKCASCHNFDQSGANKVGPGLYGVVDRDVGKHEGFSYSEAMAAHGGKWDYDSLNKFLTSPKTYVPGTKMTFAGLSKEQDRANVIAYLRTLAETPAPLPGG